MQKDVKLFLEQLDGFGMSIHFVMRLSCLTPQLRHSHRSLAQSEVMPDKFHKSTD